MTKNRIGRREKEKKKEDVGKGKSGIKKKKEITK